MNSGIWNSIQATRTHLHIYTHNQINKEEIEKEQKEMKCTNERKKKQTNTIEIILKEEKEDKTKT